MPRLGPRLLRTARERDRFIILPASDTGVRAEEVVRLVKDGWLVLAMLVTLPLRSAPLAGPDAPMTSGGLPGAPASLRLAPEGARRCEVPARADTRDHQGSPRGAGMTAPAGQSTALPRWLALRVGAIVIAGIVLLGAVTLLQAADPRIGAPWSSADGGYAPLLGVLFWGALTLFASGVSAELPEGTRLVWVLAPMVSVMSLGGPLVAGWVAALATTEPRELRGGVPWYGVLNNHAAFVISALLGAATIGLGRSLLGGMGPGVPLDDLLATLAGGLVFECSNLALTMATVRTGRWRTVLAALLSRSYVSAEGAQVAVGWLMAQAYIDTGWWTPLVFLLPALLAWQAFDRDRLRWVAGHDVLTDLANRREFGARLADTVAEARKGSRPSVLLIVDLDGFKSINDRLGHAAGDAVLRVIAERLRGATRPEDHVARLGGDEFAVILSGVPRNAANPLVERLRASLSAPITVDGATVAVGASIGIAGVDDRPPDPADLVRQADLAMLKAKGQRTQDPGPG
jgi:diguanylate cyclase (GGDEF)-like protein